MLTKTVKLVYNYESGSKLCQIWNKMTDGNFTFKCEEKSIKLVGDETSFKDADFIVVVNGGIEPNPIFFYKTIFFKMEPVFVDYRWLNVGTWPILDIFGSHGIEQIKDSFNALEWHLNKTRSELLTLQIKKTKKNTISSIISGKTMSPGHIIRLEFALFAQNFFDWDAYGNWNSQKRNWNNFLGSPEYKDDTLFPYKYSFTCENNFMNNYVTEKLVDCILAETLCFYDGAPNVENIIDPRAYIKLDLKNPVKAIEIMKRAINDNEYEKRLPFIKFEKEKIIRYTSLIPRLWKTIYKDH